MTFEVNELQERWRLLKLDQHVQITPFFLLTAHVRTKDAKPLDRVAFAQFGQVLP